ncbi:MAG: caspase family protein [Pyrinomonadaceae bacterium]
MGRTLLSLCRLVLPLVVFCGVAYAQRPELVVRAGNLDGFGDLSFSPDGRLLASDGGGNENTVSIIDAATGRELRTIYMPAQCFSTTFTPDGRQLVTGDFGGSIRFWDIRTGRELRSLKLSAGAYGGVVIDGVVTAVAVSRDGKILAGSSTDGTVVLFDVATGRKLRALKGHTEPVSDIALSPDGRTLVSGSNDKSVAVWDVATGRVLRSFKNLDAEVNAVALSPDGRVAAAGVGDGAGKQNVKVWDAQTGAELRTLAAHTDRVESLAFNPAGDRLAAGLFESYKVWDVQTGAVSYETASPEKLKANTVAFSPDGSRLARGGAQLVMHDAATWGAQYEIPARANRTIDTVAFSPKGRLILGGGFRSVDLWGGTSNNEPLAQLPRTSGSKLAFSPDGRRLVTGASLGGSSLWDTNSRQQVKELDGLLYTKGMAYSPDGKLFVAISGGTLKVFDAATWAVLRQYEAGFNSSFDCFAVSRDGSLLAGGTDNNKIIVWNLQTGAELRQMKGDDQIKSLAFSPDGKQLAAGGLLGGLKILNVGTGAVAATLIPKGHVSPLAYSHDGRLLASIGAGDGVKLWDTATNRVARTLAGHSSSVTSVAFSPDDKFILTGGADSRMKLWDSASGAELASLFALEGGWLVVTPDGLFDGSNGAWQQLFWRFNNDTFDGVPVEAFFNEYYYPGLLNELIAGARPAAPRNLARLDRRQPSLRLKVGDASAGARVAKVTLDIDEAAPQAGAGQGGGARDVRLFRNGSLVKVWRGDVLGGRGAATLAADVKLLAGENRLTAYAFNRDNVKSPDATLTVNGVESLRRKGTAYVLAVGVNSYANRDFDLKYAVADAEDFGREWRGQQAKLQTFAGTEVVSLKDSEATKANILKALSDLRAKAQPEDAVVIYFAGHGTAQANRFYLIPHDLGYAGGRDRMDEAGLRAVLEHSISDAELQDALEGVDAGQLLLVIDACNSGQALESEEKRRGPMNSKGLAQLAYEKGMYILTAAQSYQAAQEAARFGHGFLTYALIEEGVRQAKADEGPRDGRVVVREWFDYASRRVPQLQVELMREAQEKRGVKVAFVQGDEQVEDPAERNLQRPRAYYRREADARPLVVATDTR